MKTQEKTVKKKIRAWKSDKSVAVRLDEHEYALLRRRVVKETGNFSETLRRIIIPELLEEQEKSEMKKNAIKEAELLRERLTQVIIPALLLVSGCSSGRLHKSYVTPIKHEYIVFNQSAGYTPPKSCSSCTFQSYKGRLETWRCMCDVLDVKN